MERITNKIKPNSLVKLGKAHFPYEANNYFTVPHPKKMMTGLEWCKMHAKRAGGIVKKDEKGLLAVYRVERIKELHGKEAEIQATVERIQRERKDLRMGN